MRPHRVTTFAASVLLTLGASCRQVTAPPAPPVMAEMVRTELYFGLARPDGGRVGDEQWQAFVDDVVTPRFPDGFTVLDARGQWRGGDGSIVREPARVLVLFHTAADASRKLEEIRAEYRVRFAQEAVLRADQRARVGF